MSAHTGSAPPRRRAGKTVPARRRPMARTVTGQPAGLRGAGLGTAMSGGIGSTGTPAAKSRLLHRAQGIGERSESPGTAPEPLLRARRPASVVHMSEVPPENGQFPPPTSALTDPRDHQEPKSSGRLREGSPARRGHGDRRATVTRSDTAVRNTQNCPQMPHVAFCRDSFAGLDGDTRLTDCTVSTGIRSVQPPWRPTVRGARRLSTSSPHGHAGDHFPAIPLVRGVTEAGSLPREQCVISGGPCAVAHIPMRPGHLREGLSRK